MSLHPGFIDCLVLLCVCVVSLVWCAQLQFEKQKYVCTVGCVTKFTYC